MYEKVTDLPEKIWKNGASLAMVFDLL